MAIINLSFLSSLLYVEYCHDEEAPLAFVDGVGPRLVQGLYPRRREFYPRGVFLIHFFEFLKRKQRERGTSFFGKHRKPGGSLLGKRRKRGASFFGKQSLFEFFFQQAFLFEFTLEFLQFV